MNANPLKHLLWLIIIVSLVSACGRKAEPTIAPFLTISDNAVDAQAAGFEYNKCPFDTPNNIPKDMVRDIRCATLTVPEDWQQPESTKIDMAVAIVKASNEDPKPDPVLVFIGNPGIGLDLAYAMPFIFPNISDDRDFIIVDQRGSGYSEPAFECPELASLQTAMVSDLSQQEMGEQILKVSQKCADTIQLNIADLSAYSTAAAAADMEALRQALGISEWNIFTFLDGSRLAMVMMRDFPSGIRSVAMDSAIPLQANPAVDWGASAEQALENFFQRCANEDSCNEAYPRLDATFYKLLDKLDAEPIPMDITNRSSGARMKINLDSEKLLAYMLGVISTGDNNENLGELPRMIFQLKDGKTEVAARLLGQQDSLNLPVYPINIWRGCKEEWGFISLDQVKQANLNVDPHLAAYFNTQAENSLDACEPWKGPKADAFENMPVTSSIPTLLLSGEYNWSQPFSWSEQATQTLRNATAVEFAGDGQLVYAANQQADCSHRIVEAFLEAPGSQLDTSCASQANKITWITLP